MSNVYRIHGDNIIECERALALIGKAFGVVPERTSQSIYMPSYSIKTENAIYKIDLLPGHDRWNVDIKGELVKRGAPLRESTDAYITKLSEDKLSEELIFAMEYCSALPAGNNAWQRSGRAATCLEVGIPYLYFAEVGGVELDENRNVKAERTPNPIVPFSYISASRALKITCLPVYQAHPAITEELRKLYSSCFGLEDSLNLIKELLKNGSVSDAFEKLLQKGLRLVRILSDGRKRSSKVKGDHWEAYLKIEDGNEKVAWLDTNAIRETWLKKTSEKVKTSSTFKYFLFEASKISISIGAEVPICAIPVRNIEKLHDIVRKIYSKELYELFLKSVSKDCPILIVWVNGFKPKGDDSRPDRGLVPLARMLFGNKINVLTVVYGPAKAKMLKELYKNPDLMRKTNGLWEAVLNLSNYVLADSETSELGPHFLINEGRVKQERTKISLPYTAPNVAFSEHDVDTAIHSIFSTGRDNIYECLCNPPGGDWSGISIKDFQTKDKYRWTSLPRVSSIGGKRPDHVIQLLYNKTTYFLVIESKGFARDLEDNIGYNLKQYINVLFKSPPTAYKKSNLVWSAFEGGSSPISSYNTLSGGAFNLKSSDELNKIMMDKGLDFVMAFQLKRLGEASILHLRTSEQYKFLIDIIVDTVNNFSGWFEVQIH